MIPAIADALRCSVDELLGRTPSTWPFPDVAYQRFARLTPMQKGRVESAVLDTIEKIEGLGGKQTGTDG